MNKRILHIRLDRIAPCRLPRRQYPQFEFHINASARDTYQIDQSLFTSSGNLIIENFQTARSIAQKMNARRDLARHPEQVIRAGQLNAMGLVDEILHFVLRLYEETANPKVFKRALAHLNKQIGRANVAEVLRRFGMHFPPLEVYLGKVTLGQYIKQQSAGKPHKEMMLEELILLFFANSNPAFAPFRELFDDDELVDHTRYRTVIESLELFFQSEKPFGPDNQFIFDLLRAPIIASPHNLEGQLEFMREQWGLLLADKFLRRILGARDLIREDMRIAQPGGRAATVVPTYRRRAAGGLDDFEAERFTRDLDWMPKVVLLAKNSYVWLDQLSRKYSRPIRRLDEIPDEELDQLARWNFTGLWLIGIWERSPASQFIKQRMGNPEAVASAYSLRDYEIAADLGGEDAFKNLRHRAWIRGIRLAGDMVPNHVGILSRWVIEHPDYFIQNGYPPFPGYQFTGPDLSDVPGVEIRIEDGYWSRRDAAVVFQRIDRSTGSVRYIYHGNDGTSMPWNDTAQLDFLRQEVREAVIQSIFHVARKFSIIRFDAAMTLTKKHFQRLWYPQPGSGGDIPSRADHAMTVEEFNQHMPDEFWREVVDRINVEMPNTLLLAEAFWLLEGYFVRTLGMHRVYNSAFMHMLTREENAKYREAIRNTLHYNPEILKRYVNFMSNPDEQTAVQQFGSDDKYFGVATLMVTLPGLPMFAHGQIEGFREKYGMEYRRAYHDEMPDEHLIRRHEREIFPLMAKRHLFSGVENFELYDFYDHNGSINENVFAYSNCADGERALVCYHNKYEETAGWVRMSVGKTVSPTGGQENNIVRKSLSEALGLSSDERTYYVFREQRSGLEYIRSGQEMKDRGMHIQLSAFQYQVFLDFREVYDSKGEYRRLSDRLNGSGVPNLHWALKEMQLSPVHEAMEALFEPAMISAMETLCSRTTDARGDGDKLVAMLGSRHTRFVHAARDVMHSSYSEIAIGDDLRGIIHGIRSLADELQRSRKPSRKGKQSSFTNPVAKLPPFARGVDARYSSALLTAWIATFRLGDLTAAVGVREQGRKVFDELLLDEILRRSLRNVARDHDPTSAISLLRTLITYSDLWLETNEDEAIHAFRTMLEDDGVRHYIHMNLYDGVWYYNKESLDSLIDWMGITTLIQQAPQIGGVRLQQAMRRAMDLVEKLKQLSTESGYKLKEMQDLLEHSTEAVPNAVE